MYNDCNRKHMKWSQTCFFLSFSLSWSAASALLVFSRELILSSNNLFDSFSVLNANFNSERIGRTKNMVNICGESKSACNGFQMHLIKVLNSKSGWLVIKSAINSLKFESANLRMYIYASYIHVPIPTLSHEMCFLEPYQLSINQWMKPIPPLCVASKIGKYPP